MDLSKAERDEVIILLKRRICSDLKDRYEWLLAIEPRSEQTYDLSYLPLLKEDVPAVYRNRQLVVNIAREAPCVAANMDA